MKLLKLFLITIFFAGLAFAEDAKEKKVFTAAVDKDGIQRIDIVGGEYYFKPDHIIVKVNVPVEISIKKESAIVPHDFIIEAPEAGINIKEGMGKEPKVIKFTPAKTGKYPFYCSKKFLFLKSHKERGMEGVLEAVE